jgi:hypothetical protein
VGTFLVTSYLKKGIFGETNFFSDVTHIMLIDLLTQKCSQKILVSDFRYPRADNIKLKIGYGTSLYQLVSKRDYYNIKCG